MSSENKKAQTAENLLNEAQRWINKGDSALILISNQLSKRELIRVRESAEELAVAARNLKRITKRLEPRDGRCSRTCPELCPNHQQLKLPRGGA